MKMKTIFNIFRVIFGVALLLTVFISVGIESIINILSQANLLYVLFALAFFVASVVIAAFNLKIMLEPFKKIVFWKVLNYTLISNRIASLFLPGRIGEYSVIFMLKKEGIDLGVSAAAVTFDKIITLGVSALIALSGMMFFFEGSVLLKTVIGLAVVGLVGAFAMTPFVRGIIKRYILRKYASKFTGFSSTLFSYFRKNIMASALNLVITLIRVVVIALSAYFMFAALGSYPSPWLIIAIGGIETISTILPITMNGLGVKQSVGVYLYSLIGVGTAVTSARYVIGFAINYGFALVSVLFAKNMMDEGKNEDKKN